MTQNPLASIETAAPDPKNLEFWQARAAAAAGFGWPASGARHGEACFERQTVRLNDDSIVTLRGLGADILGEFTIAAAAIALLISRYSGRSAVVLPTPPLSRASWEDRVVPLVIDVPNSSTVRDYLRATAEVVENSYSAPNAAVREYFPPGVAGVSVYDDRAH
ncbi:MAG: hypothetical protein ACRD9L_15600, partial [Bryobacteraceae bacterium]